VRVLHDDPLIHAVRRSLHQVSPRQVRVVKAGELVVAGQDIHKRSPRLLMRTRDGGAPPCGEKPLTLPDLASDHAYSSQIPPISHAIPDLITRPLGCSQSGPRYM